VRPFAANFEIIGNADTLTIIFSLFTFHLKKDGLK